MPLWAIFFSPFAFGVEKSPVMTVAQARRLIARALEDEQANRPDTRSVSIIAYHQWRNSAVIVPVADEGERPDLTWAPTVIEAS